MQLVLELLKKIFIALQGVYTKAETDEIAAPIDWLKSAVDGDWKSYMLARAGMTGIQKNIDTVNRAIKEYNADNTSALAGRLIEDWENLYVGYEAWLQTLGEPSPLDAAFWTEYFKALKVWEADPSPVEWDAQNRSPYYASASTTPIINFNVTKSTEVQFHSETNVVVYLPNLESAQNILYGFLSRQSKAFLIPKNKTGSVFNYACGFVDMFAYLPARTDSGYLFAAMRLLENCTMYAPVLTSATNFFMYTQGPVEALKTIDFFVPSVKTLSLSTSYSPNIHTIRLRGGAPLATSVNISARNVTTTPMTISFGDDWEGDISFPACTTATSFVKNRAGFNQAVLLPALKDGTDAFLNAGLSAENISKTLDSLPGWTDGATHTITFTGCPGAAELTQESESVAAATARGWTVEL